MPRPGKTHQEAADEFALEMLAGLRDRIPEELWIRKYREFRQLYFSYVRKGVVEEDYYSPSRPRRLLRWLSCRYVGMRYWFRRLRGNRRRKR